MKMFKVMVASMLGAALCLGFTACSDDDDNNDNNGNNNGGDHTTTVVNPEKVFTGGMPKSALGMSITRNEEGLVTTITTEEGEKAVFEYSAAAATKDILRNQARITVTDEEGDVTELNLVLNDEGYVASCHSIDHAGTPDADDFTWQMKYDADGHLTEMRRSEGMGELTTITYKDGNVVETLTVDLEPGDMNGDGIIDDKDKWEEPTTLYYTTDEIATPIENKGCLMMFDELLDVDMDEMIYAYYAGMLGTATKHLPLRQHYPRLYDPESGETTFSDIYFSWDLNSNGYPTQLLTKDGEWEERYSFSW